MKLPWQKSDAEKTGAVEAPPATSPEAQAEAPTYPKGYTPPKGKPTPKRKVRERERGYRRTPVTTPHTAKEAREHRRKLKQSMTKAEYKAYKARERAERREEQRRIRDAMDNGDQRYLLDRDKGEVKAFVRNYVDSRRFLANWMMPFAFILLLSMLVTNAYPRVSFYVSLVAMGVMVAIFVEGVILGRRINALVRDRFPSSTEPGWGLGFYAFSRSSQPRRWRSPRAQVGIGESI